MSGNVRLGDIRCDKIVSKDENLSKDTVQKERKLINSLYEKLCVFYGFSENSKTYTHRMLITRVFEEFHSLRPYQKNVRIDIFLW